MRLRAAAALATLVVAACSRRSEVRPTPDPGDQPLPPVASKSVDPKPPPEVTRLRGDLAGRIFLVQNRVVVGEPIVAVSEFRPTKAPLTFLDGCDMDNAAGYPMRLALKAFDDQGVLVCDNVNQPAIMTFGGSGGPVTLKVGETFHENAVLNALCPAFANPGDYRVVLHRRIPVGKLQIIKPGEPYPLSCDIVPMHEGPLPAGFEPGCATMLDALPSITSELTLHVAPYDAAVVRVATELRFREASTPDDESARHRLRLWACDWLSCSCPKPPPGGELSDKDVLDALPSALPKTFPNSCRSAKP